jgi:hypothetical protein
VTPPSELTVSQVLSQASGQYMLQSPNGNLRLIDQGDGNLVLYDAMTRPLWYSGTYGKGPSQLVLQGDGNLVLYNAAGVATWSTRTYGTAPGMLALQNDGNLVLYTGNGTVAWATMTLVPYGSSGNPNPSVPAPTLVNGSTIGVGQSISGGQALTSPSGRWSLIMGADGNAIVYGPWGAQDWYSNTAGRTNAHLTLTTGGNLVIMTSGGVAIPLSSTTTGAFLQMQDDGYLVLYDSGGHPLWYITPSSPIPPGTLYAGETMAPNTALHSQNGLYTAIQQGDGNLVLYGPNGAQWASNTSYSAGAHTKLSTDGDLGVYSASGDALWSTGTSGTGTTLVMQNDGNLVLYTASSGPLWWSTYNATAPVGYSATLTQPPASTSRYVRNLGSSASANSTTMAAEGCVDAQANPAGHPYMILLDFGAQVGLGSGTWGVQLTVTTIRISDALVVSAVKAYINGYQGCTTQPSYLSVAIGTNNDGDQAVLGGAGGAVWASEVVNPLIAYAATKANVAVAGANDIEPGFNGTAAQAQSWVSGYLASTSASFLFFGSADGCPYGTAVTTGSCNYGWTQLQLYNIVFGTAPGRSLPLPEIYYTSQAQQWADISLAGVRAGTPAVPYVGPLTEVTACAQDGGSCYSMSTAQAWSALLGSVNAYVQTRLTGMLYATDLRIN